MDYSCELGKVGDTRNGKATFEDRSYYDWLPGVRCRDVTSHFNFNLGCAIKYIWRHGRKPGAKAATDLTKARDYIDFELQRIAAEAGK